MPDPWTRRQAQLSAAFDRYLERAGVTDQARRKRMKALAITVGLGSMALLVDAFLILQAQTAQRPALLEWWAPIMAIATGLIAFASLRVAFTAHREYVNAQLSQKAERGEVDARFNAMMEHIRAIRDDVREIRKELAGKHA